MAPPRASVGGHGGVAGKADDQRCKKDPSSYPYGAVIRRLIRNGGKESADCGVSVQYGYGSNYGYGFNKLRGSALIGGSFYPNYGYRARYHGTCGGR